MQQTLVPLQKLFAEPEKFEGKEIQVNGFIYKVDDKYWALSNLKSCCVRSKKEQIIIDNALNIKDENNLVTIKGYFSVKESNYHLHNVQLIESAKSFPLIFIICLFLTIFILARHHSRNKSC